MRTLISLLLISTAAVAATTTTLTLATALEPGATGVSSTISTQAAVSQAISLKRIADSLERLVTLKPLSCSPVIQCGGYSQPPLPPK